MIVELSRVRSYLQAQGDTVASEQIDVLRLVCATAERAIKDFVGYSVEQATHTHFLPDRAPNFVGDPEVYAYDLNSAGKVVPVSIGAVPEKSILALPELPVRSVTSVHEDTDAYGNQASDAFPASSLLTAGIDYYLDTRASGISTTGHLVRIGSYWPSQGRSVKVIYTAGYTAAELATGIGASFSLAALLTIQSLWTKAGETGEIKSLSLGDFSATYAEGKSGAIPADAKKLLRKFVSYSRFM